MDEDFLNSSAQIAGVVADPESIAAHPAMGDLQGEGFKGDESTKEYAQKAGEFYQQKMTEKFPDRQDDILIAREKLEQFTQNKAKEHALNKLTDQVGKADVAPEYMGRHALPILSEGYGRLSDYLNEKHAQAYVKNEATADNYRSLAKAYALQRMEGNSGTLHKVLAGATDLGRTAVEFIGTGGIASSLGKATAAAPLAQGAIGFAAQTGMMSAPHIAPLVASGDWKEVGKTLASDAIDNAAYMGIGGLGSVGKATTSKAKDWALSSLRLLAAGELSTEAKRYIGLSENPGPITKMANSAAHGDWKRFVSDAGDVGIQAAAVGLVTAGLKIAHRGENPTPQNIVSEALKNEQKGVMPSDAAWNVPKPAANVPVDESGKGVMPSTPVPEGAKPAQEPAAPVPQSPELKAMSKQMGVNIVMTPANEIRKMNAHGLFGQDFGKSAYDKATNTLHMSDELEPGKDFHDAVSQGLREARKVSRGYTPEEAEAAEIAHEHERGKDFGRGLAVPPEVYTGDGPTAPNGDRVKFVDGAKVRESLDPSFVEGGNHHALPYIPQGEIWIEKNLAEKHPQEIGPTVLHEATESGLMAGGMSYDKAHQRASVEEFKARQGQKPVPQAAPPPVKPPAEFGSLSDEEVKDLAKTMGFPSKGNRNTIINGMRKHPAFEALKAAAEGNPEAAPHSKEVTDAISRAESVAQRSGVEQASIRSGIERSLQSAHEAVRTALAGQEAAGNQEQRGSPAGQTQAASDKLIPPPDRSRLPGGGSQELEGGADVRTKTALANEESDKWRVQNKLAPLMDEARRADKEVWDKAMAKLDADPDAGKKLVDELAKKPRPVNVDEQALLLHHEIGLKNSHDKALIDYIDGFMGKASVGDMDVLEARQKAAEKAVSDFQEKVLKPTGAELGRSLRFRRILAADDYSLSGMIRKAMAAKGDQLTPEEHVKIKELQEKIAALQAKLDAREQAKETAKPGEKTDAEKVQPASPEKIAVERAKLEYKDTVAELERQKQPPLQKALNLFVRIERAMKLTSPVTVAKIAMTGAEQAVFRPMQEAAGSIWKYIPMVSEVAKRAPTEGGGLNVQRERQSFMSMWTEGLKDAWQKLKSGRSDLDVAGGAASKGMEELYSQPSTKLDNAIDMPGRLHGAEKAPVMRAEYTRAKLALQEHNAKNGIAQTPAQDAIDTVAAVKKGYSAIFMEDNVLTDMWNAALKRGGPTAENIGRLVVPFTKIPTNIVLQTMEHIFGLGIGGARLAKAMAAGFETLKPEQADSIMRQLKRGSVGAAFLAWGLLDPDRFGGLYQRDEREKKDVGWGGMKITDNFSLPVWTQHHPALAVAQIGATIRRNMNHAVKKGGATENVPQATLNALVDGAKEIPFVREADTILQYTNPREQGWAFGQTAKGFTVPAFVSWLARVTDTNSEGKTIKRNPQTIGQHIQTGIPGLRQQVPQAQRQ